MGCGILDTIKKQLGNESDQFDTKQFIDQTGNFKIELTNNVISLEINSLTQIQQLFTILNNDKITILKINSNKLPIEAIYNAVPNLSKLIIKNQEVNRRDYCFIFSDLIKELLLEFNMNTDQIYIFLNYIYGQNQFFRQQNVIYETNLSNLPLYTFEFLNFFTYLRQLNFDHTAVNNKQIMSLNMQLFEFSAQNSQITNINVLDKFQYLRKLNLSYCQLLNVKICIVTLKELRVEGCGLTEIDCEKCYNLQKLMASNNCFQFIKLNKRIQKLELSKCQLQSIVFLRQLIYLQTLVLDKNELQVDLQILKDCTQLETLSLEQCGRIYSTQNVVFEKIKVVCLSIHIDVQCIYSFHNASELVLSGEIIYEYIILNWQIFKNLHMLMFSNIHYQCQYTLSKLFPSCLIVVN